VVFGIVTVAAVLVSIVAPARRGLRRARPEGEGAMNVGRGRRVLLGAAGLVVTLVVFAAIFGPWITPEQKPSTLGDSLAQPGWKHLLGADQQGRDVLVRIVLGARRLAGGHRTHLGYCLIGIGRPARRVPWRACRSRRNEGHHGGISAILGCSPSR
jgi:ABC-type dipeptide/oligopeptide/nickel transport system permease subunit